jgi:RNA recognition motif-containing protein
MRTETELEKLIREVKQTEKQEALEKHARSYSKKTSDYDHSTIKLNGPPSSDLLQENFLKNIFSTFGLVDGVVIESGKAFVMFRYRDSALKALRELQEDSPDDMGERKLLMKDFRLKLSSTSKAQQREAKWRQKQSDPIQLIKANLRVKLAGTPYLRMSLSELEAEVRSRLK